MVVRFERGISIFCRTTNKLVNLVPDRFSWSLQQNSLLLPGSFSWILTEALTASQIQINFQKLNNFSTMSSPKPILYSYFRSSASWRVRIVLAHKGIDYEYKAINLLKKEQLGDEYRKICPMGQVPALEYNGKIITQSMAIMDFLEDIYPDITMIPKDSFTKAKVREISDIVNSGIQPLQNLSVLLKYSEEAEKRSEWANFWITKGLSSLETVLSESSGKYCVGDTVTIADACFFPQAASASRFNVDLENYPTVNRVYKNLGELQAFKAAHAFTQPDCPPELKASGSLQ